MIYADNAATTKMNAAAADAMRSCIEQAWGNPSSLYGLGQRAAEVLQDARERIAACIGASCKEITFTSGGSEADNQAIRSAALLGARRGKRHIISTAFEHHAVLHTLRRLEKEGFEVTYLPVHENGMVRLDELEAAIRPDTCLVTIMFVNNEIGTVQPIREIGQMAHDRGILFHTDAVQAFGQLPIQVEELHIDMLSASAHKMNGPKGVGCLYIRSGLKLRSFIHGGAQERSRRAGTENIPGIVGFGKALERAVRIMPEKIKKETELRDYLIKQIYEKIPYCRLNGDRSRRLPGNVNFSFQFVEGESLLIMLDMKGICGSSGSACTSGALDPSHVLLALGLSHELAHGSLRLTLSEENTREEMDTVVEAIAEIVGKLRAMSPLYEDFMKSQTAGSCASDL